jgi:hypothetical protein
MVGYIIQHKAVVTRYLRQLQPHIKNILAKMIESKQVPRYLSTNLSVSINELKEVKTKLDLNMSFYSE